MEYTIGCDPELFVFDVLNKKYVSAHDLVKGTKEDPYPVLEGATQVDGVSAEFNINPATTAEQFVSSIGCVKSFLQDQVESAGLLVADPVATFDQDYFDSLPEEARLLGCKPDYNAYTGEQNMPPSTTEPFRTGSGHVHFGYLTPEDYEEDIHRRVMQLDWTLFLTSLLWDNNHKRRELYGKPGAFRYKSYGFEYRVLSNKWVGDPELQKWVFNASLKAMQLYDQKIYLFEDYPPETFSSRKEALKYYKSINIGTGLPPLPKKYLTRTGS